MSQVWLPWHPNPERFRLRGLTRRLVWTPILLLYALFQRFPGVLFYGGAVGVCLLIWAHHELFRVVQVAFLDNPAINDPALHSRFGGALALEELRRGVGAWLSPDHAWLAYPLYPLGHELIRDLLAMGGVLLVISLVPLFGIWWERKVSAHVQNRLGPMRVGGWHGWTQTLADGVKLIAKEDFVPKEGDGPLFRLAPYLAFVPSIMAFIALPFGTQWVFRYTDVGLIFVLAMLGVEVVGVIIAGWASNNKWSVYGAMREACQMVSYEIPMGMALLLPIMVAGTLSLTAVGDMQSGGWFSWFCFRNPALFLAALAYYVASLASCKRAPFDLAESESELVAGFHTEYSGFRWSMFFFAEYCAMFVVSGLAVILFFGGWNSPVSEPWLASWLTHTWKLPDGLIKTFLVGVFASGPLWFVLKCVLLIYTQIWIRWTLPRIRIDQVLYACVQVMLPMMMLLLLGNTAWMLLFPDDGTAARIANLVLGLAGLVGVGLFAAAAWKGYRRRRQLVGYLAIEALPGS